MKYFGFPSDYLREVKVNRVTNEECNKFESYRGRIKDSQTCAGLKLGGKDACTHDSGGSLACKQKSKYCLIFGYTISLSVYLSICQSIYWFVYPCNVYPFSFSCEYLSVLSSSIYLIIYLSVNLFMLTYWLICSIISIMNWMVNLAIFGNEYFTQLILLHDSVYKLFKNKSIN